MISTLTAHIDYIFVLKSFFGSNLMTFIAVTNDFLRFTHFAIYFRVNVDSIFDNFKLLNSNFFWSSSGDLWVHFIIGWIPRIRLNGQISILNYDIMPRLLIKSEKN